MERGRRRDLAEQVADLASLRRSRHRSLGGFAYDDDADGMRVVRALLLELADNPDLSERVTRRLPEIGR